MVLNNKRNKKRKPLSNILEAFTSVMDDLKEHAKEKIGHIARLDREIAAAEKEKQQATTDMERANKIAANIAELMGKSS